MPYFDGALSSYREKISKRFRSLRNWFGRKKYRFGKKYQRYKDYFSKNFETYGKAYTKYLLFEFMPFVLAYGLMINFPASVLLGWALTVETVVSWGLIWQFFETEFYPKFKELLKEIG